MPVKVGPDDARKAIPMLLRLSSGFKIAVSPLFFWEKRNPNLLKVKTTSSFHPSHATTRLCLELLDRELDSFPRRKVLDVGCGSGILALLAARKGVPFVVGLDVDRRAIRVSEENARRNGLNQNMHWMIGTIAALRSSFDCILANLPCALLLDILKDLSELLEEGCPLILSGFQDVDRYVVAEKMAAAHLHVVEIRSGDQTFYGIPPSGSFTWMAVLARKQPVFPPGFTEEA